MPSLYKLLSTLLESLKYTVIYFSTNYVEMQENQCLKYYYVFQRNYLDLKNRYFIVK